MTREDIWQPAVDEAALAGMVRAMDEAHNDLYPVMNARAAEFVEELADAGVGRRRVLAGIGGVGTVLALAACGGSKTSTSGQEPDARAVQATGTAGGTSPYTGDLKVVALAAALENQAVAAYTAALTAAKAGKLGTVPPAAATFITTAMGHHADHAKAWNAVLTGANVPAITGIPLSTQPAVEKALGAVTSVSGVAMLALGLENQAAQTYLFAEGNVSSAGGIATAASIAPVEAMHAAVLNFVLGQYPVPDAFLGTTKAANPNTFTG